MSEQNSIEDIKTYLLVREYPDISRLTRQIAQENLQGQYKGKPRTPAQLRMDERNAFKQSLDEKSPDELALLFEHEKAKQFEESRLKDIEREQGQFYNHPSATASIKDYECYAKFATWTLDEAIALIFGKNPKIVSWDSINKTKSVPGNSPFVEQYRDLREMAQRAAEVKQLYDPVLPSFFLAWARRKEINLPQELLDNVEKFCSPIGDWQEAHGKLKEQFDILLKDRDKIVDIANRLIEERNGLKEKVAQLEANAGSQQPDKPRYSTPLLAIMEKAIAEFFDPRRNPDVKKEEFLYWLKEQMAAERMPDSDNIATAIFTLIKPPDHDPRKRRG